MVEGNHLTQDLNQVLSSELAGSTAGRNDLGQPHLAHHPSCSGVLEDHSRRPLVDELEEIDPGSTYLAPNVEDSDGTPGFLHVTEADMPLRVAIGYPKNPPRGGSRADGRQVAIEAIELWQDAIRPRVPWFRLEFVEKDPDAAVQVVWKRRINGPWAGFGRLRYEIRGGRLRVGGEMQVSTTPTGDTGMEVRVAIDELSVLLAHEFGHVLGLGHCFDCDSAMNYSWNTLGRIIVTDEDARAFLALVQQPNGFRIDGRRLSWIPEGVVTDGGAIR